MDMLEPDSGQAILVAFTARLLGLQEPEATTVRNPKSKDGLALYNSGISGYF